jgi:hypothetical protein
MIDILWAGVAQLGAVTTAIESASNSAADIKTSVLTILGVLATVGIAWAIVSGLRK